MLSEDVNAYIAAGADPAIVAGETVWLQASPSNANDPCGDSLSDALSVGVRSYSTSGPVDSGSSTSSGSKS